MRRRLLTAEQWDQLRQRRAAAGVGTEVTPAEDLLREGHCEAVLMACAKANRAHPRQALDVAAGGGRGGQRRRGRDAMNAEHPRLSYLLLPRHKAVTRSDLAAITWYACFQARRNTCLRRPKTAFSIYLSPEGVRFVNPRRHFDAQGPLRSRAGFRFTEPELAPVVPAARKDLERTIKAPRAKHHTVRAQESNWHHILLTHAGWAGLKTRLQS